MTSIENSLQQIRRLNERHQQQIEAFTRPAKEMSRLVEKLRIPVVKLSSEFTAAMKASQEIVDKFAAIRVPALRQYEKIAESLTRTQDMSCLAGKLKMPTVKLLPEFATSMKASQSIVDQFAAIRVPALKQYDEIAEALAGAQQLAPRTIPVFDNRPALFHHRRLESIPTITNNPPAVPKTSPAEDVLRRVNEQFQRQQKLEEDQRHIVVIVVTLLTGKRLCAPSMSADSDHLIRIVGEDSRKQRHEVVVGFASFQYEILTIELPPPGPEIKIV